MTRHLSALALSAPTLSYPTSAHPLGGAWSLGAGARLALLDEGDAYGTSLALLLGVMLFTGVEWGRWSAYAQAGGERQGGATTPTINLGGAVRAAARVQSDLGLALGL